MSTLLLLACANCLTNPPEPVDAIAERHRCGEQKIQAKEQQSNPRANACPSEPETAMMPLEKRQKPPSKIPQPAEALQEVSLNASQPKLMLGNSGPRVLQVQRRLQQLGHYAGQLDSRYGPQTRSAVMRYQKGQGLPPDGIVGAQTWMRLHRGSSSQPQNAPAAAATPVSQPAETARSVRKGSVLGWLVFLSVGLGLVAVARRYGSVAQLQTALAGDFPYPVERRGDGRFDEADDEFEEFEQPVMLQQSPALPNAIAWTLIGLALFGLTWASVAKIEQVVPARGQLKPQGAVKELKAPMGGVVKQVFVEEGQRVEAGDLLISFDPTTSRAELESLQKVRAALTAETDFYRRIVASPSVQSVPQDLELAPEVLALAQNRAALLAENQLLRSRLNGGSGEGADADERARLAVAKAEFEARQQTAALAVAQLEQELNKNQVQLVNARGRLATDEGVLQQIAARNRAAVANAQKSLEIDRTILGRIEPLVEEGAIARVQYDRQLQEVTQRSSTLIDESSQAQIQYDRQLQEIQTRKTEIAQLQAEQKRLRFDIAKTRAESVDTTSSLQKGILDTIAANKQKLAEIDSQLNKSILENQKRLAEINGKISQSELSLKYQDLRATVAGTVFDLQARDAGFVASNSEVLVKIVPEDSLVAEVFITNKDIGFVRENMNASIRIESFPYSEFGEIEGKVISVGSDALPPDNANQFYRFPAKIKLSEQALKVSRRKLSLQSGMAVDANIKIRENRRVISLFTDLFSKNIESLEKIK